MADTYMQYEDEDTGLVARWHGGEYIDIGYIQHQGQPGIDGDEFHAYDVINVWDHAEDCSRIPFTLDALREAVEDHLKPYSTDDEENEDDE
jgi:hypothetical protein